MKPSSQLTRAAAFAALLTAASAVSAAAQTPAATPAPAVAAAPAPLTATERARYVGIYEVAMDSRTDTLTVYEQGGDLMAQPPGMGPPSRLIRREGEVFVPEIAPDATFTFTVADGKVTGFVLLIRGERLEGTRKS